MRSRIESQEEFYQNIHLNLEIIAQEIRNCVFFKNQDSGFKGYQEENGDKVLELYTLKFDYSQDKAQIYKVVYKFIVKQGVLRKIVNRPWGSKDDSREFNFLDNLQKFNFYYLNENNELLELWDNNERLPRGVKIELEYKESGGEVSTISKNVFIYRDKEKN